MSRCDREVDISLFPLVPMKGVISNRRQVKFPMSTRVLDTGLLSLVPMKDVVSNIHWVQFPMSMVGYHHFGYHHNDLLPDHPLHGCLESMEPLIPIVRR
jgi:hypothetical protein